MVRCALSFVALLCVPATAVSGQGAVDVAEVYVVATLYQRHASTPAYAYDTLRAVIARLRPDVVVLDVSPRELRQQSVHPSKAEYPSVIFPFVRERGLRAYAAEP